MECAACCTPACSSLFYPSCAIGIGLCTCGLSLCVGLCVVSMEEEKEVRLPTHPTQPARFSRPPLECLSPLLLSRVVRPALGLLREVHCEVFVALVPAMVSPLPVQYMGCSQSSVQAGIVPPYNLGSRLALAEVILPRNLSTALCASHELPGPVPSSHGFLCLAGLFPCPGLGSTSGKRRRACWTPPRSKSLRSSTGPAPRSPSPLAAGACLATTEGYDCHPSPLLS